MRPLPARGHPGRSSDEWAELSTQTKQRAVTLVAWFSLLLLCTFSAYAATEEGIRSVRATAETIFLSGRASNANVRLVELQPWQSVVASNFTTVLARTNGGDFALQLPRFNSGRDRLFSSFLALGEATDGKLVPLGQRRFAEITAELSLHQVPFPIAASKKGLQVERVDDAIALGVQHAALNVNFSQMLARSGTTNGLPWPIDGHTVWFRPSYLESLDRQILPLSKASNVISLILLAYASGDAAQDAILLHPGYVKSAPNKLGAFNTTTAEGALHFRACFEVLADRYARPGTNHARVANFILGNEVNSHWFWANMGRVSMEEFAEDYLRTARVAATALRRISSSARLYLSLEHHWNIRYPGGDAQQAFAGRPFLDYFNRRAQEEGDFEWHLAFHPYPENLFEPRTWKDRSATTNTETPRITFKNIELLPRYLRQPALLHRGQPRRVILSEQGFHNPAGPDGELWQAAAYAYAYTKVAHLDGIDSFILHRHIDHPHEGGLNLGLRRRPAPGADPLGLETKKPIYDVFRLADTPAWRGAFEFALPVIGIQQWEDLSQ